jgi:hypothetical protein
VSPRKLWFQVGARVSGRKTRETKGLAPVVTGCNRESKFSVGLKPQALRLRLLRRLR